MKDGVLPSEGTHTCFCLMLARALIPFASLHLKVGFPSHRVIDLHHLGAKTSWP